MPEDNNFQDDQFYVDGVGFIPKGSFDRRRHLLSVRGTSNLICAALVLSVIAAQLLRIPIIYLTYLFDDNISINFYTGMITMNKTTAAIISVCTATVAIAAVAVLLGVHYRRSLKAAAVLRRPYSGVTILAVPMTLAMGIMGVIASAGLQKFLGAFGLVLPFSAVSAIAVNPYTVMMLLLTLIKGSVIELMFHGVILTALRRYGDGFAIIATSIIYALYQPDAVSIVYRFIFSIAVGYFTIRAGSVYTAVICRASAIGLIFALGLSKQYLEPSLSSVVLILFMILTFFFAGAAFIKFARSDGKAFCLEPPDDDIAFGTKLGYFIGSILFIFYALYFLYRIFPSLQIIG